MLEDHKAINNNNLMITINVIMSCFNKLEGNMVNYVDDLTSKQPKYRMHCNVYTIKVFMK
jgi:hypothetical protein